MKKITMIALAMGTIMSTQVMAADNRVNVHGSACSAYLTSDVTKIEKGYSGATNTSGATVLVTCPVPMDEVVNTTGTNFVYFNASANIACWFVSVNGDGSTRQLSAAGGGPGLVSMPNITTDDSLGAYILGCNLPAGATLRTIAISEKP